MNDTWFSNTGTYFTAAVGSGKKGDAAVSLGIVEKGRNYCGEESQDFIGE